MKTPPSRRHAILPIVVLLLLILASSIGVFAYATVKPLVAMTGQVVPRLAGPTPPAQADATARPSAPPTAGTPAQSASAAEIAGVAAATPSPDSSVTLPSLSRKQRVNFLLLGSDTDLKFAPGQYLTQSMIVVTVDPIARTVGMLSIPRDLWVLIPNYGYGKIQTAYEAGGVALARATVEQNFGIPIHYYAWVGLQGFIKMIDTIGGITMDVSHPVLDDAYPDDLNPSDPYAYMRLYIPAGPQHLTGEEALHFVRSRHGDLIGDFGRSSRQQELLLTLKQRLTGPTLVSHLPQLAADMQDSVRTDVSLGDLLQYAGFARDLKRGDIQQVVLQPPTYSQNGTSPDGSQDIVIPNWPAIDQAVAGMFQTTPQPAPGVRAASGVVRSANPIGASLPAISAPAVRTDVGARPTATERPIVTATSGPRAEAATPVVVVVENGTTITGLGQRATRYLEGNGYRLAAPFNAPRPGVARTTVTFYDLSARDVAGGIARLLNAPLMSASRGGADAPSVVVLLGADASRRF